MLILNGNQKDKIKFYKKINGSYYPDNSVNSKPTISYLISFLWLAVTKWTTHDCLEVLENSTKKGLNLNEIELEKEKGDEANQSIIKMLEDRYAFYTQKNRERKGDSAVTTYERMMLKADETIATELDKSNPDQSIIARAEQNKIRAVNGIIKIAESKKVGDDPISVFSSPTNAQQYVTNVVKQAFQGADFIEYDDFQDIMNYKFTPNIKELDNYQTYIGATNEFLKKLKGEIESFKDDTFLKNATGDLKLQYNLNIRQYIKDFSLIDGKFNLYSKGNAVQPGKTKAELTADAKNGMYKIGTIVPCAFGNRVVPLVWDGSNLISGDEGL